MTTELYKGHRIDFNPVTGSALVYSHSTSIDTEYFVKAFASDMGVNDGQPVKTDNSVQKAKQFIDTL